MRSLIAAVGLVMACASLASAQAPATPPPAVPATPDASAPPAQQQAPTPPANYTYESGGRRDPFVSLIKRGETGDGKAPLVRGDGAAGITADELTVRGVVNSRGTLAALVTGPAGKVFTVRVGDKIADGTIRAITPQYVVIQQQVNDPLSLEKQREVRKFLRGGENK